MSWTVTITEQTAEGTLVGQPVLVTVGEVQLVGGGGSLPDQSGNGGAVLGTDGTDPSWVLRIERGDVYVGVESAGDAAYAAFDDGTDYSQAKVDATGAYIEAVGSSDSASVKATPSGDIDLTHTGTLTINTVPLDVSGGSTGDVLTFDGTGIALDAPTGGGGGGGLVLVDSGTFSASSSVSLPNGTFDTTYDRYLLHLVAVPSADCEMRLRERASGTDDSGGEYAFRNTVWGNDGGGAANPTPGYTATSIGIGWALDNGRKSSWDITVDGPALSENTTFHWNGFASYTPSSTSMIHNVGAGEHADPNPFDALTIYPDTGTITGRWAVYGYAT